MATNFSPCKGSYVLNQFPSNVMFGMNGFHVSASGAIQGHHGPLVPFLTMFSTIYSSYFLIKCTLKCHLQFVSIWNSLKFCRLVMGYNRCCQIND